METNAFFTILGMGAVTYITRIAGFLIASRINMTKRMKSALSAVPGALLISIIMPELIKKGTAEWISALVVIIAAYKIKNLPLCMLIGLFTAVSLRYLLI